MKSHPQIWPVLIFGTWLCSSTCPQTACLRFPAGSIISTKWGHGCVHLGRHIWPVIFQVWGWKGRVFGQEVSIFCLWNYYEKLHWTKKRGDCGLSCPNWDYRHILGLLWAMVVFERLLYERLFLGRYNTYTHLLTPEEDPWQTKVMIASTSSLVITGFYWAYLQECGEGWLTEAMMTQRQHWKPSPNKWQAPKTQLWVLQGADVSFGHDALSQQWKNKWYRPWKYT